MTERDELDQEVYEVLAAAGFDEDVAIRHLLLQIRGLESIIQGYREGYARGMRS